MRINRKIMEGLIGRPLLPAERVHHINGREEDNRSKNLMLFKNHADHMRFEWGYDIKPIWSPPGIKSFPRGNCYQKYYGENPFNLEAGA
jgi:hypothetical protein